MERNERDLAGFLLLPSMEVECESLETFFSSLIERLGVPVEALIGLSES